MRLTILTLILAALIYDVCAAATLYMGSGETYTNLQAALSAMEAGDTLIIRDGTYTGPSNALTTSNPSPTSSTLWTTIKAENPGSVIFDGEAARRLIHIEPGSSLNLHWVFDGIVFQNASDSCIILARINYVKFLRCGFVGLSSSSDAFYTHTCNYILVEDCYSYGSARYHFHYYNTDNSIMRRCVVRHDRGSAIYQVGFQVYDSEDVEVQNCIVIDSDQGTHYNDAEQLYAFKVPQVSGGNIYFRGCIALNNQMGLFGQQASTAELINVVGWDIDNATLGNGIYSRSTTTLSHLTLGNISLAGVYGDPTSESIANSIIYGAGTGLQRTGGTMTSDYNALYGNTTDYSGVANGDHDLCAANSNAVDPIWHTSTNPSGALKYLVRIEDSSPLDGAASDSEDIGATILKKIGTSGTLYGETGYNTTTDDDLWPFPNETLIKTKMAAYTYDDGSGGDPEITGARGFCAAGKQLNGTDDITLTSYIWEYLGNEIPAEIYGTSTVTHSAGGTANWR